ncbi:testis-specific gene 13 protein isoform X2 [Hemicordylus capensis]|uniref:testis-specific gene 13 protein isoform X2 n=1 Tax=Hemicordylus capensis TaxID=884348 RepID=UPI002302644C|nr:testis-specific gene 13 protein isoform X2 [Hemicordylus capensis]
MLCLYLQWWILYMMYNHFVLKNEKDYAIRPNLVQYFIPFTDAEFQERLERHKGEIAIMLRSSEFNQDKTTLIVTNNPLPLLISGQQLATPLQFFPKDLLGKGASTPRPYCLPPLKTSQKQLFGLVRKPGQATPFRFATNKDFKGEAQFSKGYAERRLQRMYPHLRSHIGTVTTIPEPLPSIEGWSPKRSRWEPLTLSCLTETRPTLIAPGDDGFRYGKAQLWHVNNSVVPRYTK